MSKIILCYSCEHGKWERIDPDSEDREISCTGNAKPYDNSLCTKFTRKTKRK